MVGKSRPEVKAAAAGLGSARNRVGPRPLRGSNFAALRVLRIVVLLAYASLHVRSRHSPSRRPAGRPVRILCVQPRNRIRTRFAVHPLRTSRHGPAVSQISAPARPGVFRLRCEGLIVEYSQMRGSNVPVARSFTRCAAAAAALPTRCSAAGSSRAAARRDRQSFPAAVEPLPACPAAG